MGHIILPAPPILGPNIHTLCQGWALDIPDTSVLWVWQAHPEVVPQEQARKDQNVVYYFAPSHHQLMPCGC